MGTWGFLLWIEDSWTLQAVSQHLIELFYTSVTGASQSGNGQLRGLITCDPAPPPALDSIEGPAGCEPDAISSVTVHAEASRGVPVHSPAPVSLPALLGSGVPKIRLGLAIKR